MIDTVREESKAKTRVVIFHTAHPFSPTGIHSGAEMGTIHLARALARLGNSVMVIGRITSGRGDYDGVWYEDLGGSFDVRLGLARISGDVDLLVSITRADVLEASLEYPAIKKRMLWMQDSDIALTRLAPRRTNACADVIVYVSRVLRELLEKHGLSAEKGVVIHNGYDPSIFYPRPVAVEGNRIMFAGALVPEKGVYLLIESFNLLSLRVPGADLWIYGSETLWGYEQSLDPKRISFNNPRIHFAGKVQQQQLGEAYSRAAVSVIPSLPSKRLDPFPLTSIEAQASGCPVVVSTCGGLPEGVMDGVSGVVFKGEDPHVLASVLEGLLKDSGKLQAMRQAALDNVRGRFTWETIAGQFLNAAREAVTSTRPLETGTVVEEIEARHSKHILILYEHLPAYDRTGGDFYAYSLFRSMLSAGHKITLIARDTFADPAMTAFYKNAYERLGITVHCLEQIQGVNGELQRYPIKSLDDVVAGREFDAVLIFWWHIAQQFLQRLRQLLPSTRIAVNSVDVAYMRLLRQAALHDNAEEWHEATTTRRQELDAYREADVVLAITEDDEALLKSHLPGKQTAVVPYIHTLVSPVKGFAERHDLIFVAFFEHRPNMDAARFFATQIFPLVRRQLPGVKLSLVGNAPPPEVKALACKDIIVTGFVPELKPYLQQARVSVVPLRYGAGMKGKIGQSLCEGLPVVTTSVGAEGMNLENGKHVLIADDAEGFASAVVRLYTDQVLWEKVVHEGRQLVNERWSEERVGAQILDALLGPDQSVRVQTSDRVFPIIEEERKLSLVATGYDWFQQKFKESARAFFTECVERFPDFAGGYIGLAMCAHGDKRFEEVNRLAGLAAERSPESSGVSTWEALALMEEGKQKLAVAKLRHALSLQSSNDLSLRTLADLLRKQGHSKEAFEFYRQLLQKRPADIEALMKTAEIAMEVGRHESAGNLLQRAMRAAQHAKNNSAIRQIALLLQELARTGNNRSNGKKPACARNARTGIERKGDSLSQIEESLASTSLEPSNEATQEHPHTAAINAQSNRSALTSIIVLTYNNLEYTKKCIESVQRNTVAPYEIIVVDNCSTDSTRGWLGETARKKGIHTLILNEENAGFPTGVNQAINVSRGEYILLLNNDAIVTKGWLERLIDAAESDPAIAIVGPLSNLVSGVQLDTTAKYKDIARMHEHAAAVARLNKGTILPSPRVAFLCTLIARKVVDVIGGLDERFTPGNFEDDDFCLRAQLAGFKTVVAKDVFIHHYGSKSFGADGQDAYAKRLETNRQVFIVKWGADPIEIWKDGRQFRERNLCYALNRDLFLQHFERAKIQIEEKELTLALASLKKALAHFHVSEQKGYAIQYADVLNLTGNVALLLNDLATARECYEKELKMIPDRAKARSGLDKVRSAQERPLGTQDTDNASARMESSTQAEAQHALSRAEMFMHGGRLADAVKILQEAITALPDNATLHSALAWLFIRNKMFEEASGLIQSTPDSIKKNVEWLEIAGYCAEGQGFDDVASQCADKALELLPTSARALTLKGMLAAKSGNDDKATRLFALAIEQAGDMAAPQLHLGALLWQRGRREEGFAYLEKAFILDPTDAEIAVTFYSAAASLNGFHAAESRFSQASLKYPMHRQLKHFLADVLARQGKYSESMKVVESAIALFGVEGDILPFALEIRKTLGPLKIHRSNGQQRTISLCMIVKNEEQHIAKCLASVKGLIDEAIVVDTGSTDRTKQIAEAFGATVYDFAWTEDFSAARNFSLSKASGDWILVLDGDEVVSASDHTKLRDLVLSGTHGKVSYSITTRNYVQPTDTVDWVRNDGRYKEEAGTGWIPSVKVRLFPRNKMIHFEHAVHELVEPSLAAAKIQIKPLDVPIHHYGKLDIEKSRTKGEGYLTLGKLKLGETGPRDIKALSELAIQENELGHYEQALEICLRLVELAPMNARAHMGVGSNYIGLNRFEDALQPLKTSITLAPDIREAYIKYSTALLLLGRAPEAIPIMQQLMQKDPKYPYSKAMLAAVLFCSGNKANGLDVVEAMRKDHVSFDQFFADLARQLKSKGMVEYAIALIEPLNESGKITRDLAVLLVEGYKAQTLVT